MLIAGAYERLLAHNQTYVTLISKKRERENESSGASVGGKGAKVDVLPDPLTLARKSLKKAFGYVEALNLFDESPRRPEHLSEDRKVAWAVCKYGWHTVRSVGAHVSSLPGSLTDAQFLQVARQERPPHKF